MFRTLTVLVVLALSAAVASAQPNNLPLSPGITPASPIGPGMPAFGRPGGPQAFPPSGLFLPVVAPLGFSYSPYSPFYGYGGPFGVPTPLYAFPVLPAVPVQPQPAVVTAPARPEPVLAREFPAKLTLQFPTSADVWLDGKQLDGSGEERVLTSPTLKPGEKHTFAVKGRWTIGGKTYEATRSITLGPGDSSRLFVVSGDEVKK